MFYSLALRLFAGEGLRFRLRSWQVNTGGRAPWTTILFIPFSVLLHKLKSDWDKDCKILRRCPLYVNETRSSATGAAPSKRTMSITIGLESAAGVVLFAGRPSPCSRCSRSLIRITVCWRAVRHYAGG